MDHKHKFRTYGGRDLLRSTFKGRRHEPVDPVRYNALLQAFHLSLEILDDHAEFFRKVPLSSASDLVSGSKEFLLPEVVDPLRGMTFRWFTSVPHGDVRDWVVLDVTERYVILCHDRPTHKATWEPGLRYEYWVLMPSQWKKEMADGRLLVLHVPEGEGVSLPDLDLLPVDSRTPDTGDPGAEHCSDLLGVPDTSCLDDEVEM